MTSLDLKKKIPNNCKDDLKIPDVKIDTSHKLIIIHDNEKKQNIFHSKYL
jgi:hypothetical protein